MRVLVVETSVPEMIKVFSHPESVEMFKKTGVYSLMELEARNEVKWEMYIKKVQIESRVMVRMAINHIIPAALDYKHRLLKEVALSQEVFGDTSGCSVELGLINQINSYIEDISAKSEAMKKARKMANSIDDLYQRAVAYHGIAEALNDLHRPIDKLEERVDNRTWPLPKYRELLFIS